MTKKKHRAFEDLIVKGISGSNKVINIGAVGIRPNKAFNSYSKYKIAAPKMIGTDYSKEQIKLAHAKGHKEIFLSDITSQEDVNNIIKEYGHFDHVIMADVIEHIGNLTLAFDNIYRLMGDKGRLYISTPNAFGPLLADWRKKKKAKSSRMDRVDHVCWFCQYTLEILLGRSNLKPVYVEGENARTLFVIAEKMRK
jgi:SAM-dependent methyltransferase